jgi:hypothetical protein
MRTTPKLAGLGLAAAGLLLAACEVPGGNPPGSVDLVFEQPAGDTAISSLPAIVHGSFVRSASPVDPASVGTDELLGVEDTYVLTHDGEISVGIDCLDSPDLEFTIESPELSNTYEMSCGDDPVLQFSLDGHAIITVSSRTFLSGFESYSFRLYQRFM